MADNNTFSNQQLNEALQQAQEAGDQKSASIISAEIQRRSLSIPEDDPSIGQIATGVGAEIGIGLSGQTAGAALAPFTFGISYPVLAFASGVAGSIAAQKIEGQDDISIGRALFAGATNLIPGSSVAKGAVKTASAGSKVAKAGKAVLSDATRGAAIGSGEAAAISVIDEGRPPTFEEVLTYGGAGAGGNVALSGLGRIGGKLWNKIKNKTPEQIDDMVAKGEITPTELDSVPELAEAAVAKQLNVRDNAAETISNWRTSDIVASVAPSKTLGKEIQNAAIYYKNEVQAIDELGSRIANMVDSRIKKFADPEKARLAVDNFMNGKTDRLPDGLAPLEADLTIAREKIAELQSKLIANIDSGFSPQAANQREIILKSMDEGDYLTREFEFFTNKKYSPTNKQRDAVIQELSTENIAAAQAVGEELSPEAARQSAISYLNDLNKKKKSNLDSGNRFPSAIDGVLRRKKELGPALLDYLGEIKQPGQRLAGTMSRLARVTERDATDARIKTMLEEMGIATREPQEGFVEIALKRSDADGSGIYAPPSVQRALNILYVGDGQKMTNNIVTNALSDFYQAGISGSKAAKVLLNPPSYAVQVYGNAFNLAGMGINPFDSNAMKGMRLALSEYGPIERLASSPEARKALIGDMYEMSRYGIKGANVIESDIRSGLERGIFQEASEKALSPFSKLYTAPDTMGRFTAWKANQAVNKAIFPQADGKAVKTLAANVTNDTYQNYDRLSNTAKVLSRVGVVPQFASFTMEFARNQWNQGRIIREMIDGTYGQGVDGLGPANLEAMRAEGLRRLASLTALYGMTYGSIQGLNAARGVGKEEEIALKETVLPQYDESSLLAIAYDKDSQSGKYLNPSYIVPHSIGINMLHQGLLGQPIDGAIDVLAKEFVGEGSFFAQSIYGGIAGRDPQTGREISAEVDDAQNAIDRVKWVLQDAFTPGIMREAEKLGAATRGQGNLSTEDVVLRQAGRRVNDFTIEEGARFRIKDTVGKGRLAKANYTTARDYRNLSPEEVEAVYQKNNSAFRDAQELNIRHARNLATLGLSDDKRIEVMKSAGMGSTDILNAMDGVIVDIPKLERETPSKIWDEKIFSLSDKERVAEIRKIAKADPALAKSLYEKNRQDQRNKAKGIDAIDRLVLGLGVSDGARADWIRRKLQSHPNPRAYLYYLQRKGIATKEVMRQLNFREGRRAP
jgi:polyhydroxyalkanoate synthesis regulator phasin